MPAEHRETPWRAGGSGFERRARWVAGYDCRVACEHEAKGEHGQHGDELWLEVRTADAASDLCLFTYVRGGESIGPDLFGAMLTTAGVYYHFAFKPKGYQHGDAACDVLASGHCYLVGDRMLTSVAEKDDYDQRGGWVWSKTDQAALNDERLLVHPEVEHIVLAMTSGVWGRLERDLAEWRDDALGIVREKRSM